MRANQVLKVRREPAPRLSRAEPVRASAGLFVQAILREALPDLISPWRDLESRAGTPNPFASPEFLLPALRWLAPKDAMTVAIWQGSRLVGLAVIVGPGRLAPLAVIWRSEQAGLSALLYEKGAADVVLEALSDFVLAERPRAAGLRLPGVERGGPLAEAAAEIAARRGSSVEVCGVVRRAAYRPGAKDPPASRKHRKEWARQARRLADLGRLGSHIAVRTEVADDFLDLEASGWKGAQGDALALNPALTAFAREMLAGFRESGRLRAHEMTVDDKPIAIGLELRAGRRAFYWKTAYDESFAEFSPGVQLAREMTRRFEADPNIELADSCAIVDHPMIDRVWPDRVELVDLAFALRPSGRNLFRASLAFERARARVKERVKRIVYPWLGRKRS